jgi:hypothetical protein
MALFSKKPKERKTQNQPRQSQMARYYRSETGDTPSPFSKTKAQSKGRRYILGFVDLILGGLVLAAVGYSLIISPNPKVIASNTDFRATRVYQQAAADQLKHLNNRNKITFNSGALAAALKAQFPEIATVNTELPLASEQPTIRLGIDKPSFFLESQGTRYILDSSGKVIAAAANLPQITGLPVISDQSGFSISPGRQVLSAPAISFIGTVIAECRRANVPIASLVLPALAEELDMKTKDKPYFVKFYLGGDVLTETGQLLAARQHFKDTNQQPATYLDVRVAGKIFFR